MSEPTYTQTQQVKIIRNEALLEKAERLKPVLIEKQVVPTRLVDVQPDPKAIHGWQVVDAGTLDELTRRSLGKGDSVIVDFGDHRVGYLSFDVSPVGSPPDAPLKLKLTFGEMPVEMAEPFSSYEGWISSSWLQEELLFVDMLPARIELPRRYSFRYLKLEVVDSSQKYKISFRDLSVRAVTSADGAVLQPLNHPDPLLQKIDQVSIRTLEDCMQDVFEDGPKRDRRLWLGDLRLQAMANYETFRSNDLVKRCLYLFAGLPDERGRVAANLFIEPTVIADDTYMYDYSLFFAASLYDYYEASGDREALQDLWPTARKQIDLAWDYTSNGLVSVKSDWLPFIDWHPDLHKHAPAQGVLIYALKKGIRLAEAVGGPEGEQAAAVWKKAVTQAEKAAMEHLWDESQGFFVSGEECQVSWASQIWMALSETLSTEDNQKLLLRLLEQKPKIGMTTPYLHHHLVEALLISDLRTAAVAHLEFYWGAMIEDGADTFWELYDPADKSFSPYGNHLINSYCHAWSCTPTYLIRKYNL